MGKNGRMKMNHEERILKALKDHPEGLDYFQLCEEAKMLFMSDVVETVKKLQAEGKIK